MLQRYALTWVGENRLLAAGIALVVVAAAVMFVLLTGGDEVGDLTPQDPQTRADEQILEGYEDVPAADAARGGTGVAGGAGAGTAKRSRARLSAKAPARDPATGTTPGVIPGLGPAPEDTGCRPGRVDETGVSDTTITIGQIITDSTFLPQQFRPAHEGLAAYIKAFNATGGLCKRKLKLELRNDATGGAPDPGAHAQATRELADRVLAYVANESLLESVDYGTEPPFEPTVAGEKGFVPDVGGLAFAYGRSQSKWHAGIVGSVSPVLVGGGQFKHLISEARSKGAPCTKAGVVHLLEPTGASEDQAELGSIALEESWGGDLGDDGTQMFGMPLGAGQTEYQGRLELMSAAGVDCIFAYTDIQGSVNLARAMRDGGFWPPGDCTRIDPSECINVTWVPFSVYDEKFITDAGPAAEGVSTFIPHLPLAETDHDAMKAYRDALRAIPNARPSTFSLLGFASGAMLIEALQACPDKPTRRCLITSLRDLSNFKAGGLIGGTTPFRSTRVTYDGQTHDWKWIFSRSVGMRIERHGGELQFRRRNPSSGFFSDSIKVARGTT